MVEVSEYIWVHIFAIYMEFVQPIFFPGCSLLSYLKCSTLALRATFYGAKEIEDGEMKRAAQDPTEHLESDLTLSCSHPPLHPLLTWSPPCPNPALPDLSSPC